MLQRMPDGVFPLENHEPDGKRRGYAAADKDSLLSTNNAVECTALSGSNTGERKTLATYGLELHFAAFGTPIAFAALKHP